MANRAYLRCIGGGTDACLVVKYSFPDGWLDLFAPGDLHEGSACVISGATEEHTQSFVLCEASVALARFRARMNRAKVRLDGDGTVALLWRFFEAHFARGHLFADTTELQWMDEESFVASTKRALQSAQKNARRMALDPDNLLMEFGWGSGLSRQEIDERVAAARAAPMDVSAMNGLPYDPSRRYQVGDAIAHRVFGEGTVRTVSVSSMTVSFAIGSKTLAQAKG